MRSRSVHVFWPRTGLLMSWLELPSWERLAVAVEVYLTQPEAEKLDEEVLSLLVFSLPLFAEFLASAAS